ncbi:MAG TPA: hypothetical protein VFK11_01410 [Candidatus Saccharimonadales bacterium]|nr:hypothetical protein [Candidatus Saccharimonadales bacterium]
MARPSDNTKHSYTYIPPAAQKAMDQHFSNPTTMPAHLQKYQQGGYMPQHVQAAMSQHLQKNLPSHMKKYADAYVHQNVVMPNLRGGGGAGPATPPPGGGGSMRTFSPSNAPHNPRQSFTSEGQQPLGQAGNAGSPPPEDTSGGLNGNPYEFIMNPEAPKRGFYIGGTPKQKIIFGCVALIALIIMIVITNSFLSSADNAQKDRLLALAQTESEISRVAEKASENISDKNLLYRATTVKLSVDSTKQEIISALAVRGKDKLKSKDIGVEDPANDAVLTKGQQNSRFDQTYSELLQKQLSDYQKQLEEAYAGGNSTEKAIFNDANEQIKLILKDASR